MTNKDFIKLINTLIDNDKIKSIEITSWQEIGEFNGEDPRPIFNLIKY